MVNFRHHPPRTRGVASRSGAMRDNRSMFTNLISPPCRADRTRPVPATAGHRADQPAVRAPDAGQVPRQRGGAGAAAGAAGDAARRSEPAACLPPHHQGHHQEPPGRRGAGRARRADRAVVPERPPAHPHAGGAAHRQGKGWARQEPAAGRQGRCDRGSRS